MKKIAFLLLMAVAAARVTAQTDTDEILVADTTDTDDILVTGTKACDTIVRPLPWPQNLQARLDTLLTDRMFQRTQVGLMVYDLTADSVLYQRGQQQQLRPASTMKLLTSITALDQLGGDYRYYTRLYTRGRQNGHVLQGDLMCVGRMDPMFNATDLAAFVESVRAAGIDTVSGRIVADRGFKDANLLGEGWCWDDDNPVLTPLLLERKDNFVERFAEALAKAGVKDSDNLYAESMFYQLAAQKGTQNATAKQAAACIGRLLEQLGQKEGTYRIADGSGLSLYTYVTAELEVRLLRYAYHRPDIYGHLLPVLPIAGRDGTLKKRMIGTPAEGVVKAKTGTVTGVSSLAGYLTTENGHVLCFSIINQGVMSAATGRAFQDRACQAMCAPSQALPKPAPTVTRSRTTVRTRTGQARHRATTTSKSKSRKSKKKSSRRRR